MATIDTKLEAILFYQAEPLTRAHLAKLLEVSSDEIDTAVHVLTETLAERGVRLLIVGDQLELVTAPEVSDVITKTRKEELVRDLGKAGSETLSIVLYRGPVTRAEIEYIRGVNCSFVVRNLMIRGLIERIPNPKNTRSVLYAPSPELLEHLGVTRVEDLPGYATIRDEIARFEKQPHDESETSADSPN